MKICVFLLTFAAACNAISVFDLVHEQWNGFKLIHGKTYGSLTEERLRMKIYMDNAYKIAQHNKKFEMGLVSFKLKMNQFGDMLHHEFVRAMNGFNRTQPKHDSSDFWEDDLQEDEAVTFIPPAHVKLPGQVDWRKDGAVTPVKDQGKCGSCWSFSATGSLEGQHFRKTGRLVSLSEQNLMDCSTKYGNNGCQGGLMDNAFRYVKANRGLDTEAYYPYEGRDDKCRYNPADSGATDKGYTNIQSGSEEQLQVAVATVGPVSIGIDASQFSFRFYSRGVYNDPKCSSTNLDHGVLAVGYSTDKTGQDYWIVKNSWGATWGDKGYILMSRNRDNQCGVATQASYPLV